MNFGLGATRLKRAVRGDLVMKGVQLLGGKLGTTCTPSGLRTGTFACGEIAARASALAFCGDRDGVQADNTLSVFGTRFPSPGNRT